MDQRPTEVLVVGSLNIDQVVVTIKGLPKPGETLFGKEKLLFFGGKGANQAVSIARLQGRVEMIGAVGNKDDDGTKIKRNLTKESVQNDFVIEKDSITGFASVTVSGTEGENTVRLFHCLPLGT
jgi:ribokinase